MWERQDDQKRKTLERLIGCIDKMIKSTGHLDEQDTSAASAATSSIPVRDSSAGAVATWGNKQKQKLRKSMHQPSRLVGCICINKNKASQRKVNRRRFVGYKNKNNSMKMNKARAHWLDTSMGARQPARRQLQATDRLRRRWRACPIYWQPR